MKLRGVLLLSAALSLIAPIGARASVSDVQYMAGLRSATTLSDVIVVRDFAAPHDGGGGTFIKVQGPITDCSSFYPGGDDGGTVIQVTNGAMKVACYYRQFAGPVHLKWYGVTSKADSGAPDVTDQLNEALTAAELAAPGAIYSASRVVDTDAMRIHVGAGILTTNIEIQPTSG